ncbi:MAG TPA: hypothetical protein VKV73_09185 [Chloroflexota bacterium]|nr:hypothetical protein [Chloroflexota bacterium]
MMEHHGYQSCIDALVAQVERGDIADERLDPHQPLFRTQAFQIRESLCGTIQRQYETSRSHPLGHLLAHIARPGANVQHMHARSQLQRFQPRWYQFGSQLLAP